MLPGVDKRGFTQRAEREGVKLEKKERNDKDNDTLRQEDMELKKRGQNQEGSMSARERGALR